MKSLTEEKSEQTKIDSEWVEQTRSDRWRTRFDNVVSAKSKGNKERDAGFNRWSARKTKRHFDPRYEPFDKWHVSCAFNASADCQTSTDLTVSYSINHSPKILVTVSYKVRTVTILICHRPHSIHKRRPSSNLSPSRYFSIRRPHEHRIVRIFLTVTPIDPPAQKRRIKWGEGSSWRG